MKHQTTLRIRNEFAGQFQAERESQISERAMLQCSRTSQTQNDDLFIAQELPRSSEEVTRL